MLRLCGIFYLLNIVNSNQMLGPADLIFQRLEYCDGAENVIKASVVSKKYNRTHFALDIAVDTPHSLGDQTEIELKGSTYKDGGWKPGSFYLKQKDVCETLKSLLGDAFVALINSAGSNDCPFPEGQHSVSDVAFDNDKFNVPAMYGDNKMEAYITIEDEILACFIAYYELIPKNQF